MSLSLMLTLAQTLTLALTLDTALMLPLSAVVVWCAGYAMRSHIMKDDSAAKAMASAPPLMLTRNLTMTLI